MTNDGDRQIVVNTITVTVPADSNIGTETITGIPINTKYKIEETGTNDYTPAYTDNIDNTYHTLTGNSTGSVSNSYTDPAVPPVVITLKIQKIWADSDNLPQMSDVKFQLQRKVGSGSFAAFAVTNVTDNNGIFTMSGATQSTDGQRIVWTKTISDSSITDKDTINGDSITYRIQEYTAGGTPILITQTGEDYDENWIVNYNFALGDAVIRTQNERLGSEKDGSNELILAVLNAHPQSGADTPDTGRTGGYVPIVVGFIAILLAGAGYFIYKKRIFA